MDKTAYHKLDEEEESAASLLPTSPASPNQPSWFSPRSLALGLVLGTLLGSLSIFLPLPANPHHCTETSSAWSPALSIYADAEQHLTRFDGALRHSNRFRGPPSEAIDAAWAEITYPEGGLVRISQEDVRRINASEYAAEYTPEMGGGYVAGIEVLHQLHCVNMLRQATYMEYYEGRNKEWADRQTLRYHLDHCVDMLRQRLMCDPDVGMVTYVWARGWRQAFPDFSTVHKCRDYGKVLDWARANWVHGRGVQDLVRAPGARERDERP